MLDDWPVRRTVRPKSCDEGTVAPHANIPAAPQTPPAANQAGLIVMHPNFRMGRNPPLPKPTGDSSTKRLVRLRSWV